MKPVPALLCGLLVLDGTAGMRADTGSPFVLGMDRPVALALAGPDAVSGVLCGGLDAVMVERGAASVMAGFVAGRVGEIEAIGDAAVPACAGTFERDYARARTRWGESPDGIVEGSAGTALTRRAEFRVRGGLAELVERRFPGGGCDVRLVIRADAV